MPKIQEEQEKKQSGFWGSIASNLGQIVQALNTLATRFAAFATLTGTETLTNKTLTSPVIRNWDGWEDANETWTYGSADSPTFTFTIQGDQTGKYSVGMKLKLTQTTAKYFIITAISYSAPNTTVTIYGGTDYTLANAAITSPYYSAVKSPQGFPMDPAKWTVSYSDGTIRTQATPTINVWYNPGSVSTVIPIGAWNLYYKAMAEAEANGTQTIYVTLTTNPSSETDSLTTLAFENNGAASNRASIAGSVTAQILLAAKQTYYISIKTNVSGTANIWIRSDVIPSVIRAVCAYL